MSKENINAGENLLRRRVVFVAAIRKGEVRACQNRIVVLCGEISRSGSRCVASQWELLEVAIEEWRDLEVKVDMCAQEMGMSIAPLFTG